MLQWTWNFEKFIMIVLSTHLEFIIIEQVIMQFIIITGRKKHIDSNIYFQFD